MSLHQLFFSFRRFSLSISPCTAAIASVFTLFDSYASCVSNELLHAKLHALPALSPSFPTCPIPLTTALRFNSNQTELPNQGRGNHPCVQGRRSPQLWARSWCQ